MKRLCSILSLVLIALLPATAKCAARPSERETVAAVLVLEAGGTGSKGMVAVAHVIWNRSRVRGLSPYAVVTQRRQFAVMRNGAAAAIAKARRHPEWVTALRIYDTFLKSHATLFDVTYGALYFESYKGKKPAWAKMMTPTVAVGGNQFYRPKSKY